MQHQRNTSYTNTLQRLPVSCIQVTTNKIRRLTDDPYPYAAIESKLDASIANPNANPPHIRIRMFHGRLSKSETLQVGMDRIRVP